MSTTDILLLLQKEMNGLTVSSDQILLRSNLETYLSSTFFKIIISIRELFEDCRNHKLILGRPPVGNTRRPVISVLYHFCLRICLIRSGFILKTRDRTMSIEDTKTTDVDLFDPTNKSK